MYFTLGACKRSNYILASKGVNLVERNVQNG